MSAWLSQRLTANPVSLSPASWASQRPRSPLRVLPFVRTFSRYVRSNSLHAPARSFPQVTRITMASLLVDVVRSALRSGCFGSGALRGIELHLLPDRRGDGPLMQDGGELAGVLDGPVLGAKLDNRPGLFGTDARELQEFSRIREIDPHLV